MTAPSTPRGFVAREDYDAVVAERDDLAERVDAFEREARFEADAACVGPRDWALSGTDAYVMRKLARRELVSRQQFLTDWPSRDDVGDQVVDVRIHVLRSKMAAFGIEIANRHGLGWYLNAEQRAFVKAAFEGGPAHFRSEIKGAGAPLSVVYTRILECLADGACPATVVRKACHYSIHYRSALAGLIAGGWVTVTRQGKVRLAALTEAGRAALKSVRDGGGFDALS